MTFARHPVLARSGNTTCKVAPPVRVHNVVGLTVPDIDWDTITSADIPKIESPRFHNLQLEISAKKEEMSVLACGGCNRASAVQMSVTIASAKRPLVQE